MSFYVVAMDEAGFDRWIAAQASPSRAPSSAAEVAGRDLFLKSGCGACHTIRGTEAHGLVGPDLTHLGSRRSVAIDTLPLTPDNIARFIADGQHIKPGNLMPPFRIFSDAELEALSLYLAGLR